MPDDLQAFSRKIDKFNRLLSGAELRAITTRVAGKSKTVAIPAVEPNTLSHWGRGKRKGGYKVSARYEIKSDHEAATQPTQPVALAALLEFGSGSVWKAPRRRGSARRRRGTVGTYTRTPVPARHAWEKAQKVVEARAPKFVDDEVQRVLRSVF